MRLRSSQGRLSTSHPSSAVGFGLDARSDIYSAGAILLELATGRPPFFGDAGEVRHAHVNLRPPRIAELGVVPLGLAQVIQRCLAKEPGDRFTSSADLKAALLEAFSSNEPVTVAAAPSRSLPPPALAARRSVGVLFLEAEADAIALKAAAAELGGTLVHSAGDRHTMVFAPSAGGNPVLLALQAARGAIARGIARRVLVDLRAVLVRPRPGGGERYLSTALEDPGSWPLVSDPGGVLATGQAAEVLIGVQLEPVPGRDGLFRCPPPAPGESGPTVVREGAPPLLGREELIARLVGIAKLACRSRSPTVAAVLGEAGAREEPPLRRPR